MKVVINNKMFGLIMDILRGHGDCFADDKRFLQLQELEGGDVVVTRADPDEQRSEEDDKLYHSLPEEWQRALLRLAGCSGHQQLLGWRPFKGPRCRICNTEVHVFRGTAP